MPDGKKIVLVADDDPDALAYVQSILEEDFEVVGVPDGARALEEASARRPAAIILDVQMPKKDGFATLYDLRQEPATRAIPVVMLTGIAETTGVRFSAETVEAYMGERPSAYIEKPIDPHLLHQTVHRLTASEGTRD